MVRLPLLMNYLEYYLEYYPTVFHSVLFPALLVTSKHQFPSVMFHSLLLSVCLCSLMS